MSGQPSPRSRTVRWSVLAITAIVVAFLRGNHLFGVTVGVVYAAVAAGLLWLLARALRSTGSVSAWRVRLVTLFALPVAFAMAFPASINERVQFVIDDQATDRQVRSELAEVFASDPAYSDLSVSSEHKKVIRITVHGTLGTRADLERLRPLATKACSIDLRCDLVWDVFLRDTGERIDGSNQELFPEAETDDPATPVASRSRF